MSRVKFGFPLLLLVATVSFAENKSSVGQENLTEKKTFASAADGVLENSDFYRLVGPRNTEALREILVNPYQTTESQKVKVGEMFGEEIWFDPRIRPTRCLENAMESKNFAKTPEPSSLSLFLVGGAVLVVGRRKNRIRVQD